MMCDTFAYHNLWSAIITLIIEILHSETRHSEVFREVFVLIEKKDMTSIELQLERLAV